MKSFLQSPYWKTFQESIGRKTFNQESQNWSFLAIKEHGTLNTRLYTPYGPTFSDMSSFDEALTSLVKLGHEEKVTFIRIEPKAAISSSELRERGLLPVSYQQLQPAHTLSIDLRQSKEELFAQMSQNSRNITRNYQNKGVTIRTSGNPEEITVLTSLLSNVASRNHITTHTDEYFRKQAETLFPLGAATLYVAEFENTPIAAALIYDSEDTRTYAHAAADDAFRKLNAGTALVGQMILDAQKKGLAYFDLYGIADSDNPKHPWAGFTRFKKSFGGTPLTYPGAWDLPINKPGYWLYRTYQAIRKTLH